MPLWNSKKQVSTFLSSIEYGETSICKCSGHTTSSSVSLCSAVWLWLCISAVKVLNDVGYACLCLNVSTASLHFCSSIHLLICSTIVVIDDCAVYTVLSLCTSFWAAWLPRHQPIICSGTVSPGPSRAGHSGLQSPLPSAGQTALQTAQPWVDLLTLSSFCPYF